ncbi:PREDICTED: beta-D-glucosyl crocetin beta-1,6-glucosyltransferase-like [Ipomoea nil]|uniref:beta-D-glucosyl crocetin beta-1,6-glucosyltransferase-like n=1 Tax=Ipomoea nil TaxID=35883 RepID=UPI00090174FE|nr:PREDICTED: beta-D-glucosyl crocetin beta-1,6-glucosyltransferase-like [Ipomoea nil]
MGEEERRASVLMFPFLAHGHITPYLGLAKNLSDRGFLIHLCSTPIILVSVKKMIPEKYLDSIRLVELHLPELPGLPPYCHTTNGLPRHLQSTLFKALKMSKPNFAKIMETLTPDLLVLDFLQVWAEGVARALNIPAVRFYNVSAATSSYISFAVRNPGSEYPFHPLRLKGYSESIFRAAFNHLKIGERDSSWECLPNPQMVLVRSSLEMEPNYIEYYSGFIGCKVVPIGLLAQDLEQKEKLHQELLEWLWKKEDGSVVYISFGSEHFLSREDTQEIAHGLELVGSNVSFIWVLRFPQGEQVSAEDSLPQGFLKRTGERGRIVEGWAPQVEILSHPSVGGFLTHCGWNSIMETLNFAVPIIAMPMHSDQPVNAKLLVEMGLAVEITRDDGTHRLCREEIARTVKEAIGGKSGEGLKTRVKDMSKRLKMKQKEEMDAAAMELRKLCFTPHG